MNILLDTNILARLAQYNHPLHVTAKNAVIALKQSGATLVIVPQNLYEFWAVATRPVTANGLGFTLAQADAELTRLGGLYPMLPETPAIFSEWRRLVAVNNVQGKNTHDARVVAAMLVHGLTHLLTFNLTDFQRFPGISILNPTLAAAPPPP
jgi:predicted nucleic acid-binding protein